MRYSNNDESKGHQQAPKRPNSCGQVHKRDVSLLFQLSLGCLEQCLACREGAGEALMGDSQAWELGIVGAEHHPKAGQGRHSLTKQPLQPPGLRVVTYNILADQYVGTEYAQKVLFSYCPQE